MPQPNGFRVSPRRFVFFDRETGTERFEVQAAADGALPVEQAASLLAIHCLVRGAAPTDFGIMIAPEENLLEPLLSVTKRLVEACGQNHAPIALSPRQREVLRALLQDLSNKEIAGKLNVSVRTVKFHVSALLAKFHVHSRLGLSRKAADLLLPSESADASAHLRTGSRLLWADGRPATTMPAPRPLRLVAGQRASR